MEIAIIPRFIARKFFGDEANQVHANVLVSSIIIILVILLWRNDCFHLPSIPHFCVVQETLNVPCPGCGVTRSVCAVAGGDISSALKFNPAGLFLSIYFLAQIPLRIVALKFGTCRAYVSRIARIGDKFVISVLFLAWIVRLAQ